MTSVAAAALLLAAAILAAPRPILGLLPATAGRPLPGWVGFVPVALGAVIVAIAGSAALVSACVGCIVVIHVRRRRSRRVRRRRDSAQAIAGALEILTGELRAGAHPMRAFTVAAAESDGEVGDVLRAVASRARLGADVATGIRSSAAGSPVRAHWERLAVVWQLAAEHGLAMSDLMGAAHRDIVERLRFADHIHSALAGARATAVILAGLPALGVVLGQLLGAHPLRFLTGSGIGGLLLVLGVGLACIGLIWADRIVERVTG